MSSWEPCLGASDEWYTPAYIFAAVHARPKRRQGITGQTIDMETLK